MTKINQETRNPGMENKNKDVLDAPIKHLKQNWYQFWNRYRADVCEMQHLALDKKIKPISLVDKVGKMMDQSRWILDPKFDQPVADALINRLQDLREQQKRSLAENRDLRAYNRDLQIRLDKQMDRMTAKNRTIRIFKQEIVSLWRRDGLLPQPKQPTRKRRKHNASSIS